MSSRHAQELVFALFRTVFLSLQMIFIGVVGELYRYHPPAGATLSAVVEQETHQF